jgi:hypothetical protein
MIGETVGVIRPTVVTDRYGNDEWVYGTSVTHRIRGAAFDPGGTSEVLDGRTAVITRPTLYLPPGADLNATDRVVIRGRTFTVGGVPAVWTNPYSATTKGVVAPLEEVTG